MTQKLTIDEVKSRLRMVHGDTVTIDETTYVSADKRATFIDKEHGVWRAQVKSVLHGRRHTLNKGVASRLTHLLTLEELKEKLERVHGDVITVVDGQVYHHSHTKMVFRDKDYGEWDAQPYSVLAGHSHPARGRLRQGRSAKSVQILTHWKTGAPLQCTARYEVAVVKWLNDRQIDFDWQIPVLTELLTPKGKRSRYYVDVFIKTGEFAGTWVEIKGWMGANQEIGKRKWEWFHAKYPQSSQLWDCARLKQLAIL